MDEPQFWDIIESGGREAGDDLDRHLEAIRGRLLALTPEGVKDFERHLGQKMADSFSWDLWGAAYLINGGCSDDGFEYFRAWLISRGRAVYEAAVVDPDSLAGLTDPERDDYESEDLLSLARGVYGELTGQELSPHEIRWPEEPRGEPWDFDDDEQASRHLPRLANLHLD